MLSNFNSNKIFFLTLCAKTLVPFADNFTQIKGKH